MSVLAVRLATVLSLALVLSSCRASARGAGPGGAPAALRYNLTYVRAPEHAIDVEVVRVGDAPRDFLFTLPGAVDTVWAHGEEGEAQAVPVREGRVRLARGTRFVRYRYPLDARIRDHGPDLFTGMGRGEARLVAGRAYLLRPRLVTPDLRVELHVAGADALLPWSPEGNLYRLKGEDLVDSGFHGFGGRRCEARVPGAVLEVAILGRMTHATDAELCGWLERSAGEVLQVRRAFPYPRVTVRLVPVPGRSAPSLFGMVLWSSPPSIAVLVGQDAKPEAFRRDWVAVHELLHLAHPAFLPRVPWLSEGLATYYTEVARARSGRQTAREAWHELVEGFARGRADAGGRTMEEVVAGSDSSPGVYWTGALFALHLDVELRRLTGNQRGLDDVLDLLGERGSTSTLGAFGVAVDEVAGRPLFASLLERHLRRPAFSEQEALLQALGVALAREEVSFQPAADSALRDALNTRVPRLAR